MALMKFREDNRIKWRGVRPGHAGTQVIKSANATNSLAIVHTVTTAKTFFMCSATVGLILAVARLTFSVRDGSDVIQYFLADFDDLAGITSSRTWALAYWPPLEIPAGYDITIRSAGVTAYATACIHGWEE